MKLNTANIPILCIVWALALLLGVSVGTVLPLILLIVASVLMLFSRE